MGDELKGILDELNMLAQEIEKKGEIEEKSNKKTKGKKGGKKKSKNKEEEKLKKVGDLKHSIDLLEKEVFIRVDNPAVVVEELKKSKVTLKDIIQTLMAISKINKLKEDLLIALNKQIYELKGCVKNLEKELRIKEMTENEKGEGIDIDFIDNIENDIEEIRRNIGLAK